MLIIGNLKIPKNGDIKRLRDSKGLDYDELWKYSYTYASQTSLC